MIQILKKQGLKAALPLLLLATACGDGGTPSAFQLDADTVSSDGSADVVIANESGMPDLADMLEPAEGVAAESGVAVTSITSYDDAAAKVPEPTTLAGLAIAALGLGAIKRKQSA